MVLAKYDCFIGNPLGHALAWGEHFSSLPLLIPLRAIASVDDAYEALDKLSTAGFMHHGGGNDPAYEATLRQMAVHFDIVGRSSRTQMASAGADRGAKGQTHRKAKGRVVR